MNLYKRLQKEVMAISTEANPSEEDINCAAFMETCLEAYSIARSVAKDVAEATPTLTLGPCRLTARDGLLCQGGRF